jgi:hypothetical protein
VDLQPGKQVVILGGQQVPRQRLVEVMVGVHKAGQNNLSGQVQHQVRALRELLRGANLFDNPVPGEQAGIR